MSNTFQIDFVNRYYFPVTAGIEILLVQLIRHIPRSRFSVTVHTSANSLSHQNNLTKNEIFEHTHINRYSTFKKAFIPRIPWNKTDAVVITNFTIIPNVFILINVCIRKLFRRKKFRFIFFPCGGFTPYWKTIPPHVSFIKRLIHYLSAVLINYSANLVIAISEWEFTELRKSGINPTLIETMKLGVEDEAFTLPFKPVNSKKPYIIQVSRVHPIKNIETTIKALAQVPGSLSYIIAGSIEENGYLDKLKVLVKKLKLENRVTFAGKVTLEEKYRLIDGALCMVHMSRNESFGLSVYEGMSRGKACIVARNSALTKAVKNGVSGYVIDTEDVEALTARLAKFTTPIGRKELLTIGAHNKIRIKNYTWQSVSDHFVDLAMGNADL